MKTTSFLAVLVLTALVAEGAIARLQRAPLDRNATRPLPNENMSMGWESAHARWKSIERAKPAMQRAEQAVRNGRFAEAEKELRQALSIQAQNAKAWLLLAEVCEKQGKQAEALTAYHELVYSNEKGWGSNINSDVTTRMKYVLALTRANRWQEAVAVYGLAMRSTLETDGKPLLEERFDPSRRDIARLQAVAHLVLGTQRPTFGPVPADEQRKHLDEAVRLAPNMPLAQYLLGRELEKEGKKAQAAAAYRRAALRADGKLRADAQAGAQWVARS